MNLLRKQNGLLILILTAGFLLRIIGLYPNFLQHPDEPGVIEPANKIATNTILYGNPDPNVPPHPFKYASAIFYMHALIRATVIPSAYILHKTTGFTFSLSEQQFGNPSFEQFLIEIGPYALPDILLWFHRLPSVLLGVATVLLVYKLALLFFKKRSVALFAALSLAVMPHHVRDSHYATVTIIQTFFFLLAFFLSARIWQRASIKTCVLAGLATGFATSIKYFPLPVLPLLFFLFLTRRKLSLKLLLVTILAVFAGYWIGMPYIIFHLNEMVGFYKVMASLYVPNQEGKSFLERLIPAFIHGYHLQFFLKSGVGPTLTIFGVVGIIYGLIRWRLITSSLLIVPVINTLFISLYLEAVYDTLTIPVLPFFAIFIGIGTWWFTTSIKQIFQKKLISIILAVGIIFSMPLFNSAGASIACTNAITEQEAHDWIAKNLPDGATIAFQPNMRMPSKNFKFIRSDPKSAFLLSEIQESGAEYIALHSGYTDRYPQWLEDNIFLPQYVADNEFIHLVLNEFRQNSQLLESFVRPEMCTSSRIYIYRTPEILSRAEIPVASFSLDTQNKLSLWTLGKVGVPTGVEIEVVKREKENLLLYKFKSKILSDQMIKGSLPISFYGTPLRSPFIEVVSGKKYTGEIIVKRESGPGQYPDGFLRLDFFKDRNSRPILTRLSRRIKPEESEWQKLTATAYAPENVSFVTISFQTSFAGESSEYLIKGAGLYH